MPGIRKRKNGLYEIRKYQNGITKSEYTRSYSEALKIKKKLTKTNLIEKAKSKIPTLNEWINEWLETFKKPFVKNKTYLEIKNACLKIEIELGKNKLETITTQQIQHFINKFKQGRTKERICTYFNALLQKAEDLQIINKNPFKAVVKEQKGTYKNFSYNFDEQSKILKAIIGSEIEIEILLYLMTGCRPAELPTDNKINFEKNNIEINGTKNKNAKKRLLPISLNFSKYLQEKNLQEIKSKEYVQKKFKEICKEIGIEKPLLYRLRHTFATNHFVIGTPAKYVQEWLGHSTIQLTLDTYTDIDNSLSKEKIEKLYNNFYYKI